MNKNKVRELKWNLKKLRESILHFGKKKRMIEMLFMKTGFILIDMNRVVVTQLALNLYESLERLYNTILDLVLTMNWLDSD